MPNLCSPLVGHFKINSKQSPTSENDIKEMSRVSFASAFVCTRPEIAHIVRAVSRFLPNPRNEY